MSFLQALKSKAGGGAGRTDTTSDAMWTTPWAWRDEEGVYFGHNGEVWLYRSFPVSPMEWEDPDTRISIGAGLSTMLSDIGSTSSASASGLRQLANNRQIHLLSVSWDEPAEPPPSSPPALAELQRDILAFSAPQRALLVGVRLRAHTGSSSDNSSMVNQAKAAATKVLMEDVPDRAAYDKDREAMHSTMARYGARKLTASEMGQLESWYNNGRGPDTTIIERVTSLKVPAYDTLEISAVMRFGSPVLSAPNAQWALEAASHPHGPKVMSVRAELEPHQVTRGRARRSQRRVEATMKEEAATGDLEHVEYSQTFQQAQAFEQYLVDSAEPIMTNCSILLARKVRAADETYIDYLRNTYGIEVKPLEHRQIRALDEMLPCSSKRVNPFLQDVSISMVAYAGMNGFSRLGDDRGLYTGLSSPDYTPVFIDPGGAARDNKPAAMLVAGDSGSGKSFLCQLLAVQSALAGSTTIFVNPKGHDSLSAMAQMVNGTVVKMSALEASPGAFDPFRYAPPQVAAEIAAGHILSALGGEGGFTQAQELELGSALKKAAITGARCVGDAFPFLTDQRIAEQIKQQVEGSSLFALGVGLSPMPPFAGSSGLTLIEFDRKLDLPDPSRPATTHTRSEKIALAAVRLVTRASLEILNLSKGGMLVVDEAWTFLSYPEGLASLQQLGREGRSLNILPIFATQRVADVVSRDMESYLSRVFCLKLTDDRDAKTALELCGLDPTPDRIAWLKTCGPRRASGDTPARPAIALHRDLNDRHSAVVITPIPEGLRMAISTNPEDRNARTTAESQSDAGSEA